jgi:hypothetical protein
VWISLVVPLVLLVAPLLLQRLESALLSGLEPVERRGESPTARSAVDAAGSPVPTIAPALSLVPDPPSRRPHRTVGAPVARATA